MQFMNQKIKENEKACPGIHELVWLNLREAQLKMPKPRHEWNHFTEIWAAFRLKLDCPGK